jgi:hypothetical protein
MMVVVVVRVCVCADFMGQQIKNAFVLHTPRVSYLFFCITADERNLLFDQIKSIFR